MRSTVCPYRIVGYSISNWMETKSAVETSSRVVVGRSLLPPASSTPTGDGNSDP